MYQQQPSPFLRTNPQLYQPQQQINRNPAYPQYPQQQGYPYGQMPFQQQIQQQNQYQQAQNQIKNPIQNTQQAQIINNVLPQNQQQQQIGLQKSQSQTQQNLQNKGVQIKTNQPQQIIQQPQQKILNQTLQNQKTVNDNLISQQKPQIQQQQQLKPQIQQPQFQNQGFYQQQNNVQPFVYNPYQNQYIGGYNPQQFYGGNVQQIYQQQQKQQQFIPFFQQMYQNQRQQSNPIKLNMSEKEIKQQEQLLEEFKKNHLKNFVQKFEEMYGLCKLDSQEEQTKLPILKQSYQQLKNDYYQDYKKISVDLSVISGGLNEETRGLVGIANLGNMCYMSACIQCLSNLQPLTDYCLAEYYKPEINRKNIFGSKGIVAVAFAQLIKEMWSNNKKKYIEPIEFFKIISFVEPFYSRNTQEDAQEFLIFLLDKLHEDLNRVQVRTHVEFPEYTEKLSEFEQEKFAATTWQCYLKINKSVIVDLFQGQLKNSIRCTKCDFVSYKFEQFQYLNLPICQDQNPNSVDIFNCLDLFLQEESLTGENQWFCPQCNKKVDAIKKIDLWKLPHVLIISFKRFKYNKNEKVKINSSIEFEVDELDLQRYLPIKLQKNPPWYMLFAACCHKGQGLTKGHYTAYAKSKENQEWYHFDDHKVKLIEDPQKQIPKNEVYILFYQIISMEFIKQQSITRPQNWPHINH